MQSVSAKPSTATDLGARRRGLGISQQTLAVAARCSLSSVRLFEAGFDPEHSPTRERVERALDELEDGSGQPNGQHNGGTRSVPGRSPASAACDSLPHERQVVREARS
jgi:hypothetical protein